jgi:hypothetical protein
VESHQSKKKSLSFSTVRVVTLTLSTLIITFVHSLSLRPRCLPRCLFPTPFPPALALGRCESIAPLGSVDGGWIACRLTRKSQRQRDREGRERVAPLPCLSSVHVRSFVQHSSCIDSFLGLGSSSSSSSHHLMFSTWARQTALPAPLRSMSRATCCSQRRSCSAARCPTA